MGNATHMPHVAPSPYSDAVCVNAAVEINVLDYNVAIRRRTLCEWGYLAVDYLFSNPTYGKTITTIRDNITLKRTVLDLKYLRDFRVLHPSPTQTEFRFF